MITSIGYIASAFLAISLLVNNALKFRWLNLMGCCAFILYGVCIHAFPVILANSILFCINIFQLVKLFYSKESFDMLPFTHQSEMVNRFLSFYKNDIDTFFPKFKLNISEQTIAFVVLRDIVIANIFVARMDGQGNATVEINYTVANYRDYKVGRFIFEKEKEYLTSKGIENIVYTEVHNGNHKRFIEKMGFKKELLNGGECFVKHLLE